MPTGSFSLSYLPQALSAYATPSQVCLYTPGPPGKYAALPNVAVIRIDERTGASPPCANFQYLLDDNLAYNLGWPSQAEQIWPIDANPNPYVVQNDDRIVVLTYDPSGTPSVEFDGFAQIPQIDIADRAQAVSFSAVGVAAREWDSPIRGRLQRSADNPQADPSTGPVDTDLPCRFNPSDNSIADGNKGGIEANCTPLSADVNEADDTNSYPVFLDPGVESIPATVNGPAIPAPQTYWTISKACRYLMSVGNPKETYVTNPDFSVLTSLLQSYAPPPSTGVSNMQVDQGSDIVIRDYDASDKPWPVAVAELLAYGGFNFAFVTGTGSSGFPQTTIDIYRNDALTTIAPKQIFLQPAGGSIGDAPNNATSFHLARDCNHIVNQYSIESPLKQVEASFLLAPLYIPIKSDTQVTNRLLYLRSSWTPATTAVTRRAYRWYGVDELGQGHWDIEVEEWDTTAFDFSGVFPADAKTGKPLYCKRFRPGSTSLISVDTAGHPLKADLSILFDYDVSTFLPGLWPEPGDGETWFKINGGWKPLPDRLGIEVDIDDVELWNGGAKLGKIAGISWWADPTTIPTQIGGIATNTGYAPVLRLTTVIDDDRMLSVIAAKRSSSPTQFTRRRRADCQDHFQYNRVLANSLYNSTAPKPIATDLIARDDTSLALSHATALRAKTEFPPVAGSVTIPFLTDYYQLGDRISEIDGRNISLQENVGGSQGEAPDFPFVIGISQIYQPNQGLVIQLSDHRAEAANI